MPKLLTKILTSLKDDEERIKYFIIPNYIDRELMKLYERTLLTGSKKDKLNRKKLDRALKDKRAFFEFANNPAAIYRRITVKKENIEKPFQVDTKQKERPKEEELVGAFAKKWFDEVIPKMEASESKVIEHFNSPGEWKLILLDKKKENDYSFLVLELKRQTFEEWLEQM